MKYQPMFNIWEMPHAFYSHIQPGQWVYAGDRENKGIFCGVKPSGIVVVAWYGNAKNQDFRGYIRAVMCYARPVGRLRVSPNVQVKTSKV